MKIKHYFCSYRGACPRLFLSGKYNPLAAALNLFTVRSVCTPYRRKRKHLLEKIMHYSSVTARAVYVASTETIETDE
jgi:hypothetical protein